MAGRILVGTSSWADPGFVREWYPQGMEASERLPWYAERFEAVELNSSFYAIPDRNTVHRWAEVTPDGFTFDVKVHRALSRHAAQIDSLPPDMRDGVEVGPRGRVALTPELERALALRLVEEVSPLAEQGKLGSFLLQLTPAFAPGKNRLEQLDGLLEALAPHPVSVELRHRGWVRAERVEETRSWFSERRAAFVCVDAPPGDHVPIMPPLDAVTRDDLAYVRLHGRNTEGYLKGRSVAERFAWRYSDDELEEVAGRVHSLAEHAREVHVLFNNNRGDDAPTAAQRFRSLLGQEPAPPAGDEQLRLA
ncbi:MAG TPA: DUF72 domain-containing protein [Thermoleophilaceae bacterium]|nr:DUF72 domain-containing protein [Thermoleophilaceae bacterium]